MKKAIIIMAKVPKAGKVKTRLQPFLTPEQSATLSVAFLQDAENKATSVAENVFIAVSPFDERNKLKDILQHPHTLIEQTGETLGDKMLNAFKFAFEKGIDSVVMYGTDSPTFPAKYIEKAFSLLKLEEDVVLGKSEDGGFYLIGLRKIDVRVFENTLWSSAGTFEQVRRNILNLELHLQEVPSCFDVDEKEDFEKLRKALSQDAILQKRAAKTFDWMKKWQKS